MEQIKIKAVIFDLDGTLADTLADLIDSCNAMLSHFGYPTHDYETGKTFIGNGIRKLVQRALPEAVRNDERIVDAAFAKMNEEYAVRFKDKTRPYDGIPEILRCLENHQIPYAVNTNKPDAMAKKVLAACLPDGHFEMICGQLADVPKKPDPIQALKIAKKLGVQPVECCYVGDSLVDYETAVNAGMRSVLCAWGFAGREKLVQCKDAVIVNTRKELLQFFMQNSAL